MTSLWNDSINGRAITVVYGGAIDVETQQASRWAKARVMTKLARRCRGSYANRLPLEGSAVIYLYRHPGVSLAAQALRQRQAIGRLIQGHGQNGAVIAIAGDRRVYYLEFDDFGTLVQENVTHAGGHETPENYGRYLIDVQGEAATEMADYSDLPPSAGVRFNLWDTATTAKRVPIVLTQAGLPHWWQAVGIAVVVAFGLGLQSFLTFIATRNEPEVIVEVPPPMFIPASDSLPRVGLFLQDIAEAGLTRDEAGDLSLSGDEIKITGSWETGPPRYAKSYAEKVAGIWEVDAGGWAITVPLGVPEKEKLTPKMQADEAMEYLLGVASNTFAAITIEDPASGAISWTLSNDTTVGPWLYVLSEQFDDLQATISSIRCSLDDGIGANCTIDGSIDYET